MGKRSRRELSLMSIGFNLIFSDDWLCFLGVLDELFYSPIV